MIAIREWKAGAPTGRILQFPFGSLHANAATGSRRLERRRDPARISGIKRRWVAEINRRCAELKAVIRISIVDNDCFGLQPRTLLGNAPVPPVPPAPPPGIAARRIVPIAPRKFEFTTTQQKIDGFLAWLRQQQDAGILDIIQRPGGVVSAINPQWSGVYVQSYYTKRLREAYENGLRQAMAELRRAGYPVRIEPVGPTGSIRMMMQQPIHVERIGLIYSRNFEDLKTVMQVMDTQIRHRIADGLTTGLARGMAEGKHPLQIARELARDVNNRVDVIGINRLRMIARTETARAHVSASIETYRQAGVEGVEVVLEWETGANPCPECEELQAGGPYTLDEFEALFPPHPNCECAGKPAVASIRSGGEAGSQTEEEVAAAAA